jgi:formamidopyrimidine-DNA glycosylase
MIESARRPLPKSDLHYSTLGIRFTDGRTLHYVDVRRLGTVALMNPRRFERFLSSLGVEPLAPEFTASLFSGLLRASDQAIKKFIMNQSKIAGVGNIYANEALWRAKIDPSRAASRIPKESAEQLHREIVDVLQAAVDSRGTSFRDYRDANGEEGEFFSKLNAYGRAGLPCNRCGRKLVGTHAIDGRATVFCAYCQR